MYKIRILFAARQDITDTARWYNDQVYGLGRKFIQDVRKKIEIIRNNPDVYSIKYGNIRAVRVGVFPYLIHYTIEKKTKEVIISAVQHTSRQPIT